MTEMLQTAVQETGMAHASAVAAAATITRRLAALRREARAWIWIESLAAAALVAVAGGWATLVIDRLVEPPAWPRAVLLGILVAAVAWVLVTRLVGRLAVPLTDASLALAVERTHPAFADGLSTAVAYAHHRESRADEPVDDELVDATLRTVAARLGDVRAAAIFRRGRLAVLTLAALAALAGTAAAAVAGPALATVWARRMLALADVPWPRRVTLEAEGFSNGVMVVPRGSDVEVSVRATVAEGEPPEVVELRTRGSGAWRSERMGTRGGTAAASQRYGHTLKAVGEDQAVEVRGGDARLRGLSISVADPPALAAVELAYTLPDYLGGGRRHAAASRTVPVPRGSVVDLTCTTTKPLAAAVIALRPAVEHAAGPSTEQRLTELDPALAGGQSIAARTPPIDADTVVLIRLTDQAGLTNRDPVALLLTAVADQPPRLALRLAGISTAVTPQAVLPVEGTISDDHGLASATVSLVAGEIARDLPIARVEGGVEVVQLTAERPELVRLAELGLAVGTRLEVKVSARDGCTLDGAANGAEGDTWTLEVVSPEALQAMLEAREVLLRRRFEAAIDDLAKARELAVSVAGNVAPDDASARRCGEATARAGGETAEIAEEFRGIHREFANNAALTPELDTRLIAEIADPLAAMVTGELAAAAAVCRAASVEAAAGRRPIVPAVDAALARMRMVLERMLELESVNEVIERLRGVIRVQEEIRRETLERQRKRGREALESP